MIEIDVSVRDRQGRSVAGLGEDDFEVTFRGSPVEISNFSASAPGPASPAPPTDGPRADEPPAPRATPRHLLLYFDETALDRGQRAATAARLTESLRRGLDAGAQVMVAGRQGNALRIYQPFTADVDRLAAAIDQAAQGAPDNPTADAVSELLHEVDRALSAIDDRPQASARSRSRVLSARASTLVAEALQRVGQSEEIFEQLIVMLGGLPGRKGLLYVGDGLAVSPGEVIGSALRDAFSRFEMRSVSDSLDSTSAASLGGARLADAAARAAGRQVAVFALDTTESLAAPSVSAEYRSMDAGRSGGAAPTDTWTPGVASRRRSEIQNALQSVAEQTGGRLLPPRRSELIADLLDDLTTYYSLGIQVPTEDPALADLQVADLQVKVKRRGLQAHSRRAALPRPADAVDADRTVAALLGAPIEAPGRGRQLDARLTVGAIREAGDGSFVVPLTLTAPIDDLRLVARGAAHEAQLSLFLATRDSQGRVSAVRKTLLPVTLANADLATALGREVEYRQELTLPAGEAAVAVTVRDDADDAVAVRTVAFQVASSPAS